MASIGLQNARPRRPLVSIALAARRGTGSARRRRNNAVSSCGYSIYLSIAKCNIWYMFIYFIFEFVGGLVPRILSEMNLLNFCFRWRKFNFCVMGWKGEISGNRILDLRMSWGVESFYGAMRLSIYQYINDKATRTPYPWQILTGFAWRQSRCAQGKHLAVFQETAPNCGICRARAD